MRGVLPPARGPLRGTLGVPGDKSIAHRALMFGALASSGNQTVANVPHGEDVEATMDVLSLLGADIQLDDRNGVWSIQGPLRQSIP